MRCTTNAKVYIYIIISILLLLGMLPLLIIFEYVCAYRLRLEFSRD